jgi:hypothetical protein
MTKNRRRYLSAFMMALFVLLASCGGDKSSVSSGKGASGVSSDGGSSSSKYAGSYSGSITITAKGSKIDNSSTKPAVLLVRSDGTARLTIDGDNDVDGFMNGNKFGFSVRVVEEKDLIKCSADAILTGSISEGRASGSISGSGKCKVVSVKTGFDVTGSFKASR